MEERESKKREGVGEKRLLPLAHVHAKEARKRGSRGSGGRRLIKTEWSSIAHGEESKIIPNLPI